VVAVAPDTRIRIRRADIYQAVSYARHQQYAPCSTGLVYPVALNADEPLPKPMRVTGFGDPVWILFIDVGRHAQARFPEFFAAVSEAWSVSVPDVDVTPFP
jgi:5-methylcytosine-specific restriction enzyme subunit McrC